MIEDLQSKYDEYYQVQQQKLIEATVLVVLLFGSRRHHNNASFFLTSNVTSRDFRRWYGLHLTKSDIKRNFLLYSDTENTSFTNRNP